MTKLNYVHFGLDDKIKSRSIEHLVATSSNKKIFIFYDEETDVSSTRFRAYARVKRPDGLTPDSPRTLIFTELSEIVTGLTQTEINEFKSQIGITYDICRVLELTDAQMALEGDLEITLVYSEVDVNGRSLGKTAMGIVATHLYKAVEELFTEDEYDRISSEILPRDLGDVSLAGGSAKDTDWVLGKQNGNTVLTSLKNVRSYIEKYNVINLGEIDKYSSFNNVFTGGVYNFTFFGTGETFEGGLLFVTNVDNSTISQLIITHQNVKRRKWLGGYWEEFETIDLFEINKLITEGVIDDELAGFIENAVNNKIIEVNPRLSNAESAIIELNQKVQSLSNGGPKGVYNNLAELQIDIPAGNEYIYITLDNDNWNYYDSDVNQWKQGSLYQTRIIEVEVNVSVDEDGYIAKYPQQVLEIHGDMGYSEADFGNTRNRQMNRDDSVGFSGSFNVRGLKAVKYKKPIDSLGYGNRLGGMYSIDGFTEFVIDNINAAVPYGFTTTFSTFPNDLIYLTFPNSMSDNDILDLLDTKELSYLVEINENPIWVPVKNIEIASSNGTKLKINEELYKFSDEYVDNIDSDFKLTNYCEIKNLKDLPRFGLGSIRDYDDVYYFRWQYFERDYKTLYVLDASGINMPSFDFIETSNKRGIYIEAQNLIIQIEKIIINSIITEKGYTNDSDGKVLAAQDYFSENNLKVLFRYQTPITRTIAPAQNDLIINAGDTITVSTETNIMPTLLIKTVMADSSYIEMVKQELLDIIDDLDAKIDSLQYKPPIEPDTPKEWAIQALEQAKVKDYEFATNDNFTFVVVTDTHDKEHIPHLFNVILEYEKKYGNLDCLMHHGDLSDGLAGLESHKAELLSNAKHLQKTLSPVLVVPGNHDYYPVGMTDKLWHSLVLKPFTRRITMNFDKQYINSTYFYTDFETQKIRVISLDNAKTTISQRQIDWLAAEALDFSNKENKNEWAVIIQAHKATRPEVDFYQEPPTNSNEVEDILSAFASGGMHEQYSFVEQGAIEVIMWLNGHGHCDILHKPANISWHYVMTTNGHHIKRVGVPASPYAIIPSRNQDDITELAFDIFCVNRENRNVKITRVGAGNDREFTY